ncbi:MULTISPECIES: SDR family oxidoreductase [Chromohalobacter]|uniref:SDR family oxidoreductase n=1 Tax=Chromohalobacter TaxID=42054 RepID=UPI000D70F424|nr:MULTISPECIES: SDR family oxidoreductase [Chromohalobacter]NQY45795.1 SDR family oxidoreductase [Chromohalobacter sp.]NWO55985.1 3-ketoacyl-ACP reductase [Chromohalobacter salexigens]PWW34984.1 3-oxoacyl-[acyl-carrier protein] reductase [Chromohalobacter salexigens]
MTSRVRKVALVTGASRGIGRAIALQLAADGFAVAVNYAGNRALAEQVVADIEAAGGRALPVQADIGDAHAVRRLFEETQDAFGRLDVVVNNAGVMQMANMTVDNVDILDRTLATNLRGSWLVMSQAAEVLREGGRIIAFSSSVLGKSFPGYGAYIASKAGVEGLVRVLANELRGREITVNAVAPGPVATELFLEGKSDDQVQSIANLSPFERLGQPDEIAEVVSFLAGTQGRWVNGQILRVNGGMV